MDPKLHPNGMCMICCNANKAKINKDSSTRVIRNFEKCLIHKVNFFTTKTELKLKKDLKEGGNIKGNILKNGDQLQFSVLTRKIKIVEIEGNGYVNVNTFTNLNVEFIEGVTIFTDNSYYTLTEKLNNGYYSYEEFDENSEVSYILGNDKFPLPNKKYGILPKS